LLRHHLADFFVTKITLLVDLGLADVLVHGLALLPGGALPLLDGVALLLLDGVALLLMDGGAVRHGVALLLLHGLSHPFGDVNTVRTGHIVAFLCRDKVTLLLGTTQCAALLSGDWSAFLDLMDIFLRNHLGLALLNGDIIADGDQLIHAALPGNILHHGVPDSLAGSTRLLMTDGLRGLNDAGFLHHVALLDLLLSANLAHFLPHVPAFPMLAFPHTFLPAVLVVGGGPLTERSGQEQGEAEDAFHLECFDIS
jgi:hypothetical protein